VNHSAISGVGAYRPRRVVQNAELLTMIDSSEEWIRSRTGITERRWAGADETLLMMATRAAEQALTHAGVAPEEIDAVIVCTVTHLLQTPSLAASLAHDLGCRGPAAFDLSAGCSGFCHGLALADQMIRSGAARRVLLVGADRLTDLLDRKDRSVAYIFADGAGAVIVTASPTPGIGPVVWGSDGGRAEVIRQEPAWPDALDPPARPSWRMDGPAVYRWVISEMSDIARRALEEAGLKAEDLDVFIPHQANLRIIERLAESLDLPEGVLVATDVERSGNTSSASIPTAMEGIVSAGRVRPGGNALLLGFGAGLSYAAQVVTLP
jgi:3-oxoacyl-[acyl-carrier-protein] synthase III